jgi:hypothetical protein
VPAFQFDEVIAEVTWRPRGGSDEGTRGRGDSTTRAREEGSLAAMLMLYRRMCPYGITKAPAAARTS